MKKSYTRVFLVFCVFTTLSYLTNIATGQEQKSQTQTFIKNEGQIKGFDGVKYYYNHNNVYAYFLQDRVVFVTREIDYEENEKSLEAKERGDDNLAKKLAAVTSQHRFDLYFENADTNIDIRGETDTKIKHDFYLPHCPDGLLEVKSFNQVKYKNIYPDIDMVFYQDDSVLKYEFIVQPGGDPSVINLNWQGVEDIHVNKDNQVEFTSGNFVFKDKAPVSFSGERDIETSYVLEESSVKFDVAEYNEQQKLIIDPGLFWASSLEYNGYGTWGEMVSNSSGEYYVVDWEWSPDAQDVADYLNSAGTTITYGTVTGNNDIVISKFGPNGALLWTCLYGGSGDDDVNGAVGIDQDDNLFIAGTSQKEFSMASGDFPLQNWTGAFYQGWDDSQSSGTRGYLLKFLPDNTRQWATYLDIGAKLEVFDIDFDASKNIVMVGKSGGYPTYSSGIPSGSGYQGSLSGTSTSTSFIMEFSAAGALTWATWLPGVAADTYTGRACDIAIDQNTGEFYIAGDEMWSSSTPFVSELITDGYTNQGANDLFYMKFDASNQPVPAWGGYIGGAGFDKINIGAANGDTELDADGNMYMTGHTYSADFPVVDPGDACTYYDGTINDGTNITANEAGTQDGYLFKVNTAGTVVYATFFGGPDYTSMKKLKKDSHNNLWICGQQNPVGLSTITHADYYNQTMAGTSSNILLAQLMDNDYLAWLSYYGFSGGYSGYSGFDIGEPTNDSVYLYLAGKFNGLSNAGGGYQYVDGGSCTGAAVFHHYLNAEGPDSAAVSPTEVCSGTPTDITLTAYGGSPASSDVYWYTGSCGGTLLGTGNPLTVSQTLTSSETYYVNYNNACITSVCESVTLTVDPGSVAPTDADATPAAICSGSSSTISVIGGSLEPGASWEWYTESCGGTSLGSGTSISVSPTSTTTYYVRAEGSCNTTACASVTVTVKSNSTAPSSASASPDTVCLGDPVVLSFAGGTAGTGATAQWYESSCGGTAVGSGNNLSVTPSGNTTYYIRYEGDCNTTSCASVSVVTDAGGDPSISSAGPFCSTGSSVNLSAADAGGTWSGTGIADATTGEFDPALAGTGDHVISYTLPGPCADSDTETIHVDDALDATISPQADMCASDGIVFMSAADAGGTWSGPGIADASTGEFDPAAAGSGEITISYVIGSGACIDSDAETFHVYAAVDATIDPAGPFCTSDSPVTLTAASAGGTWSGSGITDPATGAFDPGAVSAGNYLITYEIINGECSDIDSESITVENAPDPTITSASDYCINDPTVFLTAASAGGTWSGNGIADTSSGEFDPGLAGEGTHTITYQNSTGTCTATDQTDVEVHPEPDISIVSANDPLCFGDSDGNIQVSSSADSPVFTWPDMSNGNTYSNLSAGTYVVSVQDAYACENSTDITLIEPPELIVSFEDIQHLTCYGTDDGSLTASAAGGTTGGNYVWSWNTGDDVPSISGLSEGTYTITVTDDNGCETIASENITQPDEIVLTESVSDVQCQTNAPGSCGVSVSGGSGSYTYQWDNSPVNAPVLTEVSAGTYSITVEDSNGCSNTSTMTVETSGNVDVSIDLVEPVSCHGDSDGILSASGEGVEPQTYLWNPGNLTNNPISSLSAGNYQVTVTDDRGCTGTNSYLLTDPEPIDYDANIDSVTCHGSEDGAVSLNISGGAQPVVCLWSNGHNGPSIADLNGGWYSFTLTDDEGCQARDSVFVYEPVSSLYMDIHVQNVSCYEASDGVLTARPHGGTKPYYFAWSAHGNQVATDSVADGLGEGVYELTVTDAQGCAMDTIASINQPQPLSVDFTYDDPSCIGSSDGYIVLEVEGGTQPYRYFVEDIPYPLPYIENLEQGSYNIRVLDANDCEYKLNSITLMDNPVDCLRIPNAFTPNADDNNDTWIIENIEMFDKYMIKVFNRWGQKLYEAHPGEEPWDGRNKNGKYVPAGSYMYLINLNNGSEPYTGIVTVVY